MSSKKKKHTSTSDVIAVMKNYIDNQLKRRRDEVKMRAQWEDWPNEEANLCRGKVSLVSIIHVC